MLFQIIFLLVLVFIIFPFAIGNQVKFRKDEFDRNNKKKH